MVRALLSGSKTQTRRLVAIRDFGPSETQGYDWTFRGRYGLWNDVSHARLMEQCPYGAPGDQMWVRETWGYFGGDEYLYQQDPGSVLYRADEGRDAARWRPSIHMPRWASRITLEVTEVRVQRLQDISEADARAEGVCPFFEVYENIGRDQCITSGERAEDAPFRASYACLWDEINGDRAPWAENPWVWAVSFRRVQP